MKKHEEIRRRRTLAAPLRGTNSRGGPNPGALKLLDHARRVTDREHARGDVFRDDGAGADDRVISDRDSGQHDHAAAEPHVVADRDGVSRFDPGPAGLVPERVERCEELALRADENVVADRDGGDVESGEAEVDFDVVAEVHVRAEVEEERRANSGALPHAAENLGKERLRLSGIGGVRFGETLGAVVGTHVEPHDVAIDLVPITIAEALFGGAAVVGQFCGRVRVTSHAFNLTSVRDGVSCSDGCWPTLAHPFNWGA